MAKKQEKNTRILFNAQSAELTKIRINLQDSQTKGGGLVRKVDQLTAMMEKVTQEKDSAILAAKKAEEGANTHKESVEGMLKDLEAQNKAGAAQIKQLKDEVKTLIGEKVIYISEHDKEVAMIRADLERLLLEHAVLKSEVKLYQEDGGVMALD